MFILDSVPCADAFPADGASGPSVAQIIAQNGSNGGYAAVTGADAYVQQAYSDVDGRGRPTGIIIWTPQAHVAPGNIILAPGCRGVRFRNYVAGIVATVSAGLSEPAEPPLTLTSAGVSAVTTGSSMVKIGETILSAPLSSIVMSGLVQTFTHLLVVYSLAQDGPPAATDANVFMRFNGDGTVGNYNDELARANNGAFTVADQLNNSAVYLGESPAVSSPVSSFGTAMVVIPFYARTDRFKTIEGLSGAFGTNAAGGLWGQFTNGTWKNTSAITRLDFVSHGPGTQSFIAGSGASVYGF